jgi:Tfp pilus assembly protein PilV
LSRPGIKLVNPLNYLGNRWRSKHSSLFSAKIESPITFVSFRLARRHGIIQVLAFARGGHGNMHAMLRRRRGRSSQAGMSLIELLIAGVVLVVGFAGVMVLMMNAVAFNGRNKKDTTSAALAQMVLERIQTLPDGSTTTTTVTDCASTPNTWTIDSAVGGSTLSGGAIDFTASKVTNYNMQYVVCDATGQQATYDVRWNIASATTHTTYVVIGARPIGGASGDRYFALPVTVRSMVGQ